MKSNFKLLLVALPAVLAIASFENLTSQESEDQSFEDRVLQTISKLHRGASP